MVKGLEIQKLVQDQRNFFHNLETRDLSKRLEILKRLQMVLIQQEPLLIKAVNQDFGKSEFDTFNTELLLIHQEIRYFIKNLQKLARPQPVKTNLANWPGKSLLVAEPLGICLIIGAWNYPIQLVILPAIAAIAAGNTVVLKPSELTPRTAHVIEGIITKTFAKEWITVVQGDAEVVHELLEQRFDHVFFTGSTEVGKIVYQQAAKNLTPVTLELGGKSPAIIAPSAVLEVAAKRIAWGKFINAGQTCIAPDYLYIHESIREPFIELLVETLKKTNYVSGSAHYPRIIHSGHLNRLRTLIEHTDILYGGESDVSSRYFEPTLVELENWEHPLMKEEIFGPILPILTYTDQNQLWAFLRKKEKPLAAYLFTTSQDDKRQFKNQLSFGGGCINDTLMHVANPNLPFGGTGNSGIGRYHGRFGWATFTHLKPVLEKANWGEPNVKYPPYTNSKLSWIRKLWKWI